MVGPVMAMATASRDVERNRAYKGGQQQYALKGRYTQMRVVHYQTIWEIAVCRRGNTVVVLLRQSTEQRSTTVKE